LRPPRDGFKGVEYLFPYAFAKQELAARLKANGLQQVLFNAPPGGTDAPSITGVAGGDKGMACHPGARGRVPRRCGAGAGLCAGAGLPAHPRDGRAAARRA
jgi:hydroxypyruvate isomerase